MIWNTGAMYRQNTAFGFPSRWIVVAALLVFVAVLTAVALSQRFGSVCEASPLDAGVCLPPPQREVPRPLPGHAPTPRIDFGATTA
jgi:hypothetical protein